MDPLTESQLQDPKPEPDVVHEGLYWILFWGTWVVYALLLGLACLTWDMGIPGLNVGFPIVLVVLFHFFKSWGSVSEKEWAVLYFYGRALRSVMPGPYFMPWGLMQIRKAPKGLDQRQAPGEPEQVFHGDDKEPLPNGMVRAIRITTRPPVGEPKSPLDAQMTAEWSFYVQFQILKPFGFFSRVGTFNEAWKTIRDTGEAVLGEFASRMTMSEMIENLELINRELDNRIRILANEWFMQIYQAKALSPNVSHALAEELRNVPVARLKSEQIRELARAEGDKLAVEGEGAASAKKADLLAQAAGREAELLAEAAGLKAKKKALGVSGEDVLASETAIEVMGSANAVVVGASGGMADLMGLIKAGQTVLNTPPTKGGKQDG